MPTFCIIRPQQEKPKRICSSWLLIWDCNGIDWWIFIKKKRKAEAQLYIGAVTVANENSHENVHMGSKRERDVNGTLCSKWGKKLYMAIPLAMYTYVQMDAILPTIIDKYNLLICFFFQTSFDISPKYFIGIVRLIWHSYKNFLDCLSQLSDTWPLDYYDGCGGYHMKD